MVSPHQRSHETPQHDEQSDDMVKDPVCQTYIPKSLAIRKQRAGTELYFCSEECAAKYAEQQQSEAS
jgi:YHS domain-containing protein